MEGKEASKEGVTQQVAAVGNGAQSCWETCRDVLVSFLLLQHIPAVTNL